MKKLSIIIIAILFIAGCTSPDTLKEVVIKDKYSIQLPSFLKAGTGINEDASLEYENLRREFYVIVIDESKKEASDALIESDLIDMYTSDLEGYSEFIFDSFKMQVPLSKNTELTDIKINGLNAKTASFVGNIENMDVYYSLTFIEGKDTYYQIMSWTLLENKEKEKNYMDNIKMTFKEIN